MQYASRGVSRFRKAPFAPKRNYRMSHWRITRIGIKSWYLRDNRLSLRSEDLLNKSDWKRYRKFLIKKFKSREKIVFTQSVILYVHYILQKFHFIPKDFSLLRDTLIFFLKALFRLLLLWTYYEVCIICIPIIITIYILLLYTHQWNFNTPVAQWCNRQTHNRKRKPPTFTAHKQVYVLA